MSRIVAALYDTGMAAMERELLAARRGGLLAEARGRVLDVGAGTGANLAHYPWNRVTEATLLDPSAGMLERAGRRAAELGGPVRMEVGRAERLPFDDESFDSVVFTLSLCTIPDPAAALAEAGRVLRPDGRLLVFEHVRSPDPGLAAWQDRLTPLWRPVAGGCHLNRDTRAAIETAGFAFESIDEFSEGRIPIPILRPHLVGVARI